jgi:DinB superfamily
MSIAITQDLFISMVLAEWKKQNANLDKLFDTLPPEKWMQAIAPGKNRGIYLVGHLVAVNDGIATILGIGEKLYPHLEGIFLSNPDSVEREMPSLAELRQYWTNINTRLEKYFATMPAADWFSRHTAVSEEAFTKEPNRNKLNILINRSNHQSYHLGQLALLK